MNLFNLFAKISLDTSEYEEGLEKSEKQAKSFGSSLKDGLRTAAKVGGIALGAMTAAIGAVSTALVKGTGKWAEYGDSIDKNSQKIGFSAKGYQEWDHILKHNGSSIESVQRGLMSLENAAKNGNKAFEKLGITQEDLAKMNSEELWNATITGLQNVSDGGERAALAQELFGRQAKELGPLLNMTAEDTEAMRKRFNELGGVMSDDAVKAAAAYQDSLQDLGVSIDAIKRGVATEFMPGITGVMNGLTDIFSGDSESGIGKVSAGISDMVTKISEKMPELIALGSEIIGAIGQAIIDNFPTIIDSGASILLELAKGIIENLPELVQTGLSIIVQLATSLGEALPELIPAITDVILKIVEVLTDPDNITQLLNAGVSIMFGIVDGLMQAVPELIAKAPEIISNLVTALIDAAPLLLDAGAELINKGIEGIKSGWEAFKSIFDFTWEWPKIELPHFAVTPKGWKIGDLLKGSIPKLGIEWYAKAYDTPYMFNSPTVFGNKGFGDGPGGELVYGRDALMRDIKQASGGKNINFSPTININGDITDPEEKAKELMRSMKEILSREEAAYA